jgi:hypothetical protein
LSVSLPPRSKKDKPATGTIDVTYRLVDTMRMWLPAAMDESFEAARDGVAQRVTGHAEYSNYRQFTTTGRIK